MTMTTATQEALFLSMIVKDFDLQTTKPVRIYGDNQGAIALVKNQPNHNKSKHIDIKFHSFAKNTRKDLELIYVPTNDNIADLMTKPATKIKLDKFQKFIFGSDNKVDH